MAATGDGGAVDPNTGMSENNMKKGEVQNQVNFFMLGLIIVLIVSILIICSKFLELSYHLKDWQFIEQMN